MSATEEVRIEQEELDAIKKSVLTISRRDLVDAIDPVNHLTYLRSKFVLTERDAEEISAPASRSARAEVLLDKLSLKGSKAYDEFQYSLCRDGTQLFLLTSMTKNLELLKHKVREYKAQQMREQQEQQKRKQDNLQHTHCNSYHQRPTHGSSPHSQQSSPSPPPQPQYNGANFRPSQSRQETAMSYQPTPLQQAQREAYCRQRLAELGQQQQQRQQQKTVHQIPLPQTATQYQSMGFSPPPRYQSHLFTSPPQSHTPHYHHKHTAPPRQAPPNFQSRGSTDDDDHLIDDLIATEDIPNDYSAEGLPHITSAPLDMPCGQPT